MSDMDYKFTERLEQVTLYKIATNLRFSFSCCLLSFDYRCHILIVIIWICIAAAFQS